MTTGPAIPGVNEELAELLNGICNGPHLPAEPAYRLMQMMQEENGDPSRSLITCDFNHIRILTWWHDHLYSDILAAGQGKARLARILDLREEISAVRVTTAFPAYRRNPSLKTYLLSVLDEAFRLAVIRQMTIAETPAAPKLAVTLSVAELALLLRLMDMQGIFRAGSVREILRFAVAGFRSKRQGDFSFRNLSKEYYGANQVTAAGIRDLLLKMVDSLNRQFFPILAAAALLTGTF